MRLQLNKKIEYRPKEIEDRWQRIWRERGIYRTKIDRDKPKFYCLDFFPYPSGDGLSVGHLRNYIPTDVFSRYKRMRGYNVLHPMGWDAFGLPAENEAIKRALHPDITVPRYIENYRIQMSIIGLSYDWEREINSSKSDYYRWTQWFFLFLYDRGLAYRARSLVNYCPKCGTVLAREEVIDGRCWRCDSEVTRLEKEQWFFRITAYADRLLCDLALIDWPENIIEMQKNWLGKSEGIEFDIPIVGQSKSLRVFTTRADTIFGMSYIAISPEHPLVEEMILPDRRKKLNEFMAMVAKKVEIERLSKESEPLGMFTGSFGVNPINGERIPIYLADYVLSTYGTGAIMAVPAHDERDFVFAKRYNLPIKVVIRGGEIPYTGEGVMVESGDFTSLPTEEGRERVVSYLASLGIGERRCYYKLRDWLISRQRYWGSPIPIVYCKVCGEVAVRELPVLLPKVDEYRPSGAGESPLANIPGFVHTTCPECGGKAERETDTMGGFACSSWYFLRFASPHYDKGPFNRTEVDYWLPVDLYVGGAEHAVMHLLYARFWTKVMYDAGLIGFVEPFITLKTQGVVHAETGKRMSKSKGNVITPDEILKKHSVDALRLYELFIAPFDQPVVWNTKGIIGQERFLKKVWGFVVEGFTFQGSRFRVQGSVSNIQTRKRVLSSLHRVIKKVTEDIELFKFNTAIAGMMEFVNEIGSITMDEDTKMEITEKLLLILSPFAPHVCEELWHIIGQKESITEMAWPGYSEELVRENLLTIPVQVNGRMRAKLEVEKGIGRDEIERLAMERVNKWTGTGVNRVIYVQDRLVNIVTRD